MPTFIVKPIYEQQSYTEWNKNGYVIDLNTKVYTGKHVRQTILLVCFKNQFLRVFLFEFLCWFFWGLVGFGLGLVGFFFS